MTFLRLTEASVRKNTMPLLGIVNGGFRFQRLIRDSITVKFLQNSLSEMLTIYQDDVSA